MGKDGGELERKYRRVLEHLGIRHGLLGLVFRKAQNKIQDSAKLMRLIPDLLDKGTCSGGGTAHRALQALLSP